MTHDSAASPVDAIVVNYNTRELLGACLRSLAESRHKLARTFTVDNASVDDSAQMVRAQFPNVELLALDENVGFARGNNAAFELSQAPYILLLNPDAEIDPDALDLMLAHMDASPDVGIVGPMLLSPDGSVQFEGGRRDPTILGEFSNIAHLNVRLPNGIFGGYMMNEWDHRSTRDVEVLSGACMLLRRDALDGKLFRDDFFMYGEDVELCQRLRAGGWRMRYLAEARVLHHGGASSKKARTRMRVAGVVSMAQLLSRSRGPLYALGYLATVPVAWPLGVIVKRIWPR